MKYAKFNESGELIARYDDEVNTSIPDDAILLSEDAFAQSLSGPDGLWKRGEKSGELVRHEKPGPTPEQQQAAFVGAVQFQLDSQARAKGYDNILSACSYASQPIGAPFQAESSAFVAWRSAVWTAIYAVLDDVKAGKRSLPTQDETVALIPQLVLK